MADCVCDMQVIIHSGKKMGPDDGNSKTQWQVPMLQSVLQPWRLSKKVTQPAYSVESPFLRP
jgi:hypothetical protein